jgi:hypothetical protein
MKKLYTFLVVVLTTLSSTAQIINIPDANFKAKLLAASPTNQIASSQTPDANGHVTTYSKIDTNNDGEIQVSEAETIKFLSFEYGSILSVTGIEFFTNLQTFGCGNNGLTSIDVSQNLNLKYLYLSINQLTTLDLSQNLALIGLQCTGNPLGTLNLSQNIQLKSLVCIASQLSSLDVSNNIALEYLMCDNNPLNALDVSQNVSLQKLYCTNNQLTSLDISENTSLKELSCYNNQITSLDVSQNPALEVLYCYNNQITSLDIQYQPLKTLWCYNNQLTYLIYKVGPVSYSLDFNNSTLTYVCTDEDKINFVQQRINSYWLSSTCHVNSYCSFTPGGTFYTTTGNVNIDVNNNGCDITDAVFPKLKFSVASGTNTGTLISNESGTYSIPVQAGTHTITPVFENPSYFSILPTSATFTFPASTSPNIQDFCVTGNGIHNDVEATIIATIPARPGFDANYKIIYKNKGNQVSNGTVNLNFNDAVMDLVSALPVNTSSATNSLIWAYSNLNPFETREINLTFNINSPMETPAVNAGTILNYTATIVGATDEMPNDNTFTLNQTVVNSYDPNDKTCLEGSTITPSMVGQYVHYVIRFENTGTFPAQNVVVTDVIDTTKFDLSSLVPQSSSHSYVTRINSTTGKTEFIFENINLPFDDANNDGYVAFKIKTKSTLVLGNNFSNTANIYFDYNFPIVTNTATTTIATLSNQDFDFGSYFTVYPVPAKDVLHLNTKNEIGLKSLSIYNTLGQMVLAVTNPDNNATIDVANLKTGTYFIKVMTDRGTTNTKFIKE